MLVKQIAPLVNQALKETIGESVIVNEDLSNLVDAGEAVINAGQVDNYGRSISNLVGKTVFVTRVYEGRYPSLRKDAWEFGSIARKIRVVMTEATENETWELKKGASYDPNIFTPAETHEKFFNKRTTFEIPISLTEIQIKESFQSAEQMNSFLSMIETMVTNVMTKATENLAMRTVNNMIAETLHSEVADGNYSGRSGVKAVNLLYLYNTEYGTNLTPAESIKTPEFIRFAAFTLGVYSERIGTYSTLFNIGKTEKFTPASRLKMILLTDFKKAADVFLQSDAFHNEYTKLPGADSAPFWQGAGTDFGFDSITKINVVTSEGNSVEASGILGVMFDEEACCICNDHRRTTSGYNPRGEFYNYWHKADCQYLNDFDENFIVFYVA